jgi:probable rRNA maturation factor
VPVVLRCETVRGRSYARGLRADARRVLSAAGLARAELSIVLADDRAIRALNRDFRGKDRATDVLSFSQLEQAGAPAPAPLAPDGCAEQLLGDVVISIDTALAQARRMRIVPAARLRTLLIHGLLHLLGYDHERSPADARRMFARERELAAALAAGGGAHRPKRHRTGAGVARAGARTRPSR